MLERNKGDIAAAEGYASRALEVATGTGNRAVEAWVILQTARLAVRRGELDAARSALAGVHPSASAPQRDELRRMLAQRHGADDDASTWPGIEFDELVHRIVAETDIKYAPLIAILCGTD